MLLYIKSSFFELDKIEYEIKKPFLITVEKKCIFFLPFEKMFQVNAN